MRFYDEKGLLTPHSVDDATGYRRYAPSQLRRAATISVLRQMGMPLRQVQEIVDNPDRYGELMARYQEQVAAERAAEDEAMTRGLAVLASYDQPVAVDHRRAPRQHWVGAVMDVDVNQVDAESDAQEYNALFARLVQALQGAGNPPTGAFWTTIRAEEDDQAGQLLLCWPVAQPVAPGFTVDGVRLERGTLPERTEAFVTLRFDDPGFPSGPPGAGVPHPRFIALLEAIQESGGGRQDGVEIRQVGVLGETGHPVGIDVTVTVPS